MLCKSFKDPRPKTQDQKPKTKNPRPKAHYSIEMRKAAAVAHGEKTSDTIANAPSRYRCGAGSMPIILASTAPAPKINAGMYSGKTKIEINTPPPRKPNVNAAPTDPIKLKIGVPNNKLITRIQSVSFGISNWSPTSGAINTSGI